MVLDLIAYWLTRFKAVSEYIQLPTCCKRVLPCRVQLRAVSPLQIFLITTILRRCLWRNPNLSDVWGLIWQLITVLVFGLVWDHRFLSIWQIYHQQVVFCRNTGMVPRDGATLTIWGCTITLLKREARKVPGLAPTTNSFLKALYCHVSDYQRPPASRSYHRIYWKHSLLHRGFLYHHLLFALAYEATLPARAYFKSGRSRYIFLCLVSLSKVRLRFY